MGFVFFFVFYCAVCFGFYFYRIAVYIGSDAMHNFASVECSAFEVNIKVLVGRDQQRLGYDVFGVERNTS